MKRFLLGLFIFISFQANGSHVIGGDITYKNLGGDTFEIYLNLISDCALQTGHPATATINISGACPSFNFILVADSILPSGSAYQEFIEHGCSSTIGTGLSYCNGGNLPGYRRTTYTGIVILPQGCGNYTLGYQYSCCPPPMINVSVTSQSVYVETTIKDEAYNQNTGPRAFTKNHIPAFYLNQQASYDFGFEDPDGDSLFYEFVHAFAYPNQPAIYNIGFSFQQPIPGMTIDSLSGLMQFVPTTAGNYRVAVKVSEYDPLTDSLKSTVIRDLLFLVHNNLPNQTINLPSVATPKVIRNIYPSPINKHIKICLGDSLKFDMAIKDPNGDSLEVFTNLQHILPGATITASAPFSSDSVNVTIRWLANQTFDYRKFLRVGIVDDACPLRGYANDVYAISVFNSGISVTSNSIQFCPSDTLYLNGNGTSNHYWQTIGDNAPFIACDTCPNTNISAALNAKLLHTATIDNQCGVADTFYLSLKPTQKAQINVIDTFCNNNQPHWENAATPKGGMWLGMVHNGWSLTLADTSGGWRTIRYAITDSVCGLPDTAVKQVYLYSAPSIVWTDSFEVCKGDTAIFVNTSSPPANGWGAAAINGWFNPKNGFLGKNTIVLILTDTNTYCRTHVYSHVFVHPKPAMSFKQIPPICETEDSINLNYAIPVGGQYFGNGFTGEFVSPKDLGPGFHEVFYTNEDTIGCRDTIAKTFKVDTVPPQPQILLLGSDTISSSIEGDSYRWFWNGVELSNQSNTLVNPQAGNYELIVISGTCESPISSRFFYNPNGIEKHSLSSVNVYPNPSNGYFTIQVNDQLIGEKVEIYNQLGQVIWESVLNQTQVEVSGFAHGVYFLQVNGERRKLVVR